MIGAPAATVAATSSASNVSPASYSPPAFTVTALPETSTTCPKATDFGDLVSQPDDPIGTWSETSVHCGSTVQSGGTERCGAVSLIYQYRLEFDGEDSARHHSSKIYRSESDPDSVLVVQQWDSHDAFHTISERVGPEFNRRAGTEGLDSDTDVWVFSDAPTR